MSVKMGTLEHTLNSSLQQLEDHQGVQLDKDSWRFVFHPCCLILLDCCIIKGKTGGA